MEHAAKVDEPKQEGQDGEEKVQPAVERNRAIENPKTDPVYALEDTENDEKFFFPRQLSQPEKESRSTDLPCGTHGVRSHVQGKGVSLQQHCNPTISGRDYIQFRADCASHLRKRGGDSCELNAMVARPAKCPPSSLMSQPLICLVLRGG